MAMHRTSRQLLDGPQLNAIDYFRRDGRLIDAGRAMRVRQIDADDDRPDRPSIRQCLGRSSGPLDGLRIVDFTHAWLGPYATWLLSDLGAKVIKVEGPCRPDLWRYDAAGPMRVAAPDVHPLNVRPNFQMANRGKRSISIVLDTEAGRDVALENFRPRALENLQLTQ